jgi:hypothetical protein
MPVRVEISKRFDDKDGEIGDEEELHTRSDVKIEADPVAFYTSTGSHTRFSVLGGKWGCKEGANAPD